MVVALWYGFLRHFVTYQRRAREAGRRARNNNIIIVIYYDNGNYSPDGALFVNDTPPRPGVGGNGRLLTDTYCTTRSHCDPPRARTPMLCGGYTAAARMCVREVTYLRIIPGRPARRICFIRPTKLIGN